MGPGKWGVHTRGSLLPIKYVPSEPPNPGQVLSIQYAFDLTWPGPTRTVIASKAIPSDTCILSCPFDLAITKDLAIGAVKACVWDATHVSDRQTPSVLPARIDRLNEHQIICAYIGLHWIYANDDKNK